MRTVVPVEDANRHRPAIELARLHGGAEQHAVLVPRANRWLSRRYRIGVQLVGGDRPRHAGFLGRAAQERWVDLLDGLRQQGRFVRVPAIIVGAARLYRVELDLRRSRARRDAPGARADDRPRGIPLGVGARPRYLRRRDRLLGLLPREVGADAVHVERAHLGDEVVEHGAGEGARLREDADAVLERHDRGIEVMFIAAASCCWSSVSTFANTRSGFASDAAS